MLEYHTEDMLLESKTYENNIVDLIDGCFSIVKEIAYPVTHFSAKGSESKAMTFFDSVSQSYRLVASSEGGEIVSGQYVKGEVVDSTKDPNLLVNGAITLHEGRYFVITDENTIDTICMVVA